MISQLISNFSTKKVTHRFKNYLMHMIFDLGEIHDNVEDSRRVLEIFLKHHCNQATARQRVYLGELMRQLSGEMTHRARITEFTFEYFFILNPNYSSELQLQLRDDFMPIIEKAFDFNRIYHCNKNQLCIDTIHGGCVTDTSESHREPIKRTSS